MNDVLTQYLGAPWTIPAALTDPVEILRLEAEKIVKEDNLEEDAFIVGDQMAISAAYSWNNRNIDIRARLYRHDTPYLNTSLALPIEEAKKLKPDELRYSLHKFYHDFRDEIIRKYKEEKAKKAAEQLNCTRGFGYYLDTNGLSTSDLITCRNNIAIGFRRYMNEHGFAGTFNWTSSLDQPLDEIRYFTYTLVGYRANGLKEYSCKGAIGDCHMREFVKKTSIWQIDKGRAIAKDFIEKYIPETDKKVEERKMNKYGKKITAVYYNEDTNTVAVKTYDGTVGVAKFHGCEGETFDLATGISIGYLRCIMSNTKVREIITSTTAEGLGTIVKTIANLYIEKVSGCVVEHIVKTKLYTVQHNKKKAKK